MKIMAFFQKLSRYIYFLIPAKLRKNRRGKIFRAQSPPTQTLRPKEMIPAFYLKKCALSPGAGRFGATQPFWGFKGLWGVLGPNLLRPPRI